MRAGEEGRPQLLPTLVGSVGSDHHGCFTDRPLATVQYIAILNHLQYCYIKYTTHVQFTLDQLRATVLKDITRPTTQGDKGWSHKRVPLANLHGRFPVGGATVVEE